MSLPIRSSAYSGPKIARRISPASASSASRRACTAASGDGKACGSARASAAPTLRSTIDAAPQRAMPFIRAFLLPAAARCCALQRPSSLPSTLATTAATGRLAPAGRLLDLAALAIGVGHGALGAAAAPLGTITAPLALAARLRRRPRPVRPRRPLAAARRDRLGLCAASTGGAAHALLLHLTRRLRCAERALGLCGRRLRARAPLRSALPPSPWPELGSTS